MKPPKHFLNECEQPTWQFSAVAHQQHFASELHFFATI
jgi:hypothetical protein